MKHDWPFSPEMVEKPFFKKSDCWLKLSSSFNSGLYNQKKCYKDIAKYCCLDKLIKIPNIDKK